MDIIYTNPINDSHPHPRFSIMAVLAKGLPIMFIPEQLAIAAMRNDMVNYRRRSQSSILPALRAQRMLLQEGRSCFPPSGVVPPCIRAAAHTVGAVLPVFPAIHAAVAEVGASGKTAGASWRSRHVVHLTSPASAYRARRRCCRRSDSSSPGQAPSPAPPHRPPSRWIFLYPA